MLDIKGKKIAVLCDTEEKVREFCNAINYKVDKETFKCDHPKRLYIRFDIDGDLTWDSHDYFQRNNHKLITFDEFMNGKVEIKKEEKKVNKFKVGDIVRILDGSKIKDYTGGFVWGMKQNIGKLATISKIETRGKRYCYLLVGHGCLYDERGLELVSQSPNKTLTITTSDTTTTLTDGSHTTTINRYYADKHNERNAVSIVIDKYYDELAEIERVSKLPKVGDKVKVVDHGRCYCTYGGWFIENNIDVEYALKWVEGKCLNYGEEFVVVAVHPHRRHKKENIALVTGIKGTFMINVEGLEVI